MPPLITTPPSSTSSGLRAGLTTYGDQDFALFLRKAFIKGAGYTDDALDRPIVGILDTSSGYNPCHANTTPLIEAVKRGVLLAGALPIQFPIISLHESFAHPTSMYLRNLMSMDAEEMIRAQPMDCVILIGGCDKTVPAELMGAISANKPAVQLVTGPMLTSTYVPTDSEAHTMANSLRGIRMGACTDCRRLWASYRAGEMDIEELGRVNEILVPGPGTCGVMGTASTMACLAEALGMAPLGSSTPPAVSAARLRVAEKVGGIAAGLAGATADVSVDSDVGTKVRPRDVLRRMNFENAITVLQALGGSTNAIIHLLAIAGRVPAIDITLEDIDTIGRRTPLLLDLKPSGMGYMEDFYNEGGLPALLRVLKPLLHLDAMTITGRTLGEELDSYPPTPVPISLLVSNPHELTRSLIRPLTDPVFPSSSLVVLKGNIAPCGAVLKQSAASPKFTSKEFVGRAVVFDGVKDLVMRVDDPNLDVNENSVMILRGIGLIGGGDSGNGMDSSDMEKDPGLGMPESGLIPIPKKLGKQGVKDMLRISDGRMSGTAFGSVVLHISPEAGGLHLGRQADTMGESAAGHSQGSPPPLALVKTNDLIRIDVPRRVIEMLVTPEVIDQRGREWIQERTRRSDNSGRKRPAVRGYEALYRKHVMPAHLGADFDFLRAGGNMKSEM